MTRKELYSKIKAFNLQSEIKTRYGYNYTQCTNHQLETVINSRCDSNIPTEIGSSLSKSVNRLIEILHKKKILLKSEVETIMKA